MQFGLVEAVLHWGQYRPKLPALIENGEVITYAQLSIRARKIAALLLSRKASGGRIAIWIGSKCDFIASVVGVLSVNGSTVVLHHNSPGEVLRTNLRDTQPTMLLCDDIDVHHFDIYRSICNDHVLRIQEAESMKPMAVAQLLSLAQSRSDREWGIVFSSGTTGAPKAVERDHYSMITEMLGWCLELGLRKGTTFYIGRPLFYTGGLVLATSVLLSSGTLVCDRYENAENPIEVWRCYLMAIDRGQLDYAFFTPDQIRYFCQIADSNANSLRAKTILIMGAPISGHEKLEAREKLGSQVVESWGNSESLGTITDPGDLDTRPDSIGRPFVTDEMCIVDENGKRVDPGQVGCLAGGVEAGFASYSNRPEETNRVKGDNLIVSDDMGYVDADGHYYIVGRKQEAVIMNGRTIHLPTVEAVLRELPLIYECAVFPFQDDKELALQGALILAPKHIAPDNLLEIVNGSLDKEDRLQRVTVLDELPKLAVGKVDRRKLALIMRKSELQWYD